ncbi:transposase [Burkholderia sp. Bp8986]|uniref:transposase n=1 Tax=Burkholderia sp. Bp8986 TaxID=2184550 RepID=UPI001C8AA700|nr:transposase [Burkholderia sp. Bp8986]
MPYKARQNNGEPRKRKKPGYRVTNGHEYNLSLKRRGMIGLYFCGGELKAHFINAQTHTRGVPGRESTYTVAYIQLIFTFYRLFGWGMRQITGYMEDYWATRGLDIAVPSCGQLCDRFAALEVTLTQRCERAVRRLARGEVVSLIIDSSDLRFGHAGQWHKVKYGRDASRTPWRKMQLAIDPDMNLHLHTLRITDTQVSDSEGLEAILAEGLSPGRVIADGAYTASSATRRWCRRASRQSSRPPPRRTPSCTAGRTPGEHHLA